MTKGEKLSKNEKIGEKRKVTFSKRFFRLFLFKSPFRRDFFI